MESSSPGAITLQPNSYHKAFGNISTFNRLPTELVVHIFKQSIPTPALHASTLVFPSPRSSFGRKSPPLSLGWVCKRWRAILYATPQLWDTLEVWGPHQYDWNIGIINDWLKRSAELPLTLVYGLNGRPISNEDIDVLKSVSHRCQDLTFNCHWNRDSVKLLAPLKGSFRKLQRLTTIVSDVGSEFDVFLDAPDLRIFRTSSRTSFVWKLIPFDQLTEFVALTKYRAEDCVRLIQDCPNLVLCTLSTILSFINPLADRHVVTHTRLQVLTTIHCNGLVQFLKTTSFPSLRELRLDGSITKSGGIKSFKTLNPAFWDPIQRVCFGNPSTASAKCIPPLLRLMPSIVEVEIHQPPDSLSTLLDSFVPTSRRRSLLAPLMHTLTIVVIQSHSIRDWDRAALIRMLRNRCQVAEADQSLTTTLKLVKVKGSTANKLVDMVQVQKEGLGDYIEVSERGPQD